LPPAGLTGLHQGQIGVLGQQKFVCMIMKHMKYLQSCFIRGKVRDLDCINVASMYASHWGDSASCLRRGSGTYHHPKGIEIERAPIPKPMNL
jgi:hypothetical protein